MSHEAERVGFEPTVTDKATTLFESAPINHSGTSPSYSIVANPGQLLVNQPVSVAENERTAA